MENQATNRELETARRVIETTDTHLFLTGRAGTGKTTFLRNLRQHSPKRMVVLAPTGIAAINAKGVTIHSFFQLPFAPFVPGANYSAKNESKMKKKKIKLIQSIDLLVIDEISMVRADLLDAVDAALKRYRHNNLPFGGVQLLLIGDLQQLAPVAKEEEWRMLSRYYETPYFFSSLALKQTHYIIVELQHVYRQSDPYFLSLLNAVREGRAEKEVLDALNKRYIPDFRPQSADGYVRLVTHNDQAQRINEEELNKLSGRSYIYNARTEGKFPEYSYPTDERLVLKNGAQIMFVKNDQEKRYFNGMIGEIVEIGPKGFTVVPKGDPGTRIEVSPEEWENTRYGLDEKTQEIVEIVEGKFQQFPVKLAWAITIHKSQGLTFERVVINAAGSFAHGQTYVALSRCKTLEGIVLSAPIPPSAIITDATVTRYVNEMLTHTPDGEALDRMSVNYGLSLLCEVFTFDKERAKLTACKRIFDEYLYKSYPELSAAFGGLYAAFAVEVDDVAKRFHTQYETMLNAAGGDLAEGGLQERIKKGAHYFSQKLTPLADFLKKARPEIDNAEVKRRFAETSAELSAELSVHLQLLEGIDKSGFNVKDYLDERARLTLSSEDKKENEKPQKEEKPAQYEVPTEIENPNLYFRLMAYRKKKAEEEGRTPSNVLTVKSIIAISAYLPTTTAELKRIPKVGGKTIENYGEDILRMVMDYNEAEGGEPSEKPDKPLPVSSPHLTLGLYRQGLSPKAIAEQRSMTESTILGHLATFIATGEVKLEELISPEKFDRVMNYFKTHPYVKGETRMTEVKAALDGVEYSDLRVVFNYLDAQEDNQ